MNGVGIAVAGIGIGLRHALDGDHVAAVMSLLQRGVGAGRAARVAALWTLGHSVSFFVVGMVHGLAGSASLALVSSTTLPSRGAAAMYLALFAAGTVVGMVAVTAALSWPLRSALSVSRALPRVAGAASVGVGVVIAWSALRGGAS